MTMFRIRTIAFLFATVSALATSQAHAVQRTHVSAAIGLDTNTAAGCTPAAPCRTFQAAMTVTDSNGEVVVLDSGGYGAVVITKSVALIAPKGVYAGILVFPDGNGVTIATPGINVVLRGLSINGQGGFFAIEMTAGNRLTVENCVISNSVRGISVFGNTTVRVTNTSIDSRGDGIVLGSGAHATITRSTISGTGGGAGVFVAGDTAGSTTTADIARTTFAGNLDGIDARSQNASAVVKVSVRDSHFLKNRNFALFASSDAGAAVILSASNNIVSGGRFGITARGTGTKVWISGNTVSDNSDVGLLSTDSAVFGSAGNNAVRNNGLDTSGTITPVGTK
jgi:Right handed beta helix region